MLSNIFQTSEKVIQTSTSTTEKSDEALKPEVAEVKEKIEEKLITNTKANNPEIILEVKKPEIEISTKPTDEKKSASNASCNNDIISNEKREASSIGSRDKFQEELQKKLKKENFGLRKIDDKAKERPRPMKSNERNEFEEKVRKIKSNINKKTALGRSLDPKTMNSGLVLGKVIDREPQESNPIVGE